jgi:hypothetical protein
MNQDKALHLTTEQRQALRQVLEPKEGTSDFEIFLLQESRYGPGTLKVLTRLTNSATGGRSYTLRGTSNTWEIISSGSWQQ